AGTATVEVPALAEAPAEAPEGAPRAFWGPQRIAGIAVAGVGVVGVAVGAAFGAKAISKKGDLSGHCGSQTPIRCDAEGVAIRADANAAANVSNVAFAIGGA